MNVYKSSEMKIEENLNQLSRSLELSPRDWQQAMQDLSEFGSNFIESQISKPANHPIVKPLSGSISPPDYGQSFKEIFDDFDKHALHSGIEVTSGRFFGYIPGGGMPAAAIGDALAALTNRYSGVEALAPGAVDIENQVVRWIRHLLNWPESSWGTLQSGGSMATLTAVLAARSTRPPNEWSQSVVYCSAEAHHCFDKALRIAGLEMTPLRKIGTDSHGKLLIEELKHQIVEDKKNSLMPWILCATAGTTNLGAIDPLIECANICKNENIWLHVDAAYGGFFWLTPKGKARLEGMQLADSVVLDPHKGLFQPYGVGIVLVRNATLLKKSLTSHASYLRDVTSEDQYSPMDYSPELTRHFRALRIWVSLKHHGLKAFQAAIEEKLLLAKHLYDVLTKIKDIEVFSEPELSIVAFRIKGPEPKTTNVKTEALLNQILKVGKIHLSSTQIQGFTYLRICILSFRSHLEHIEAAVEEIQTALSLIL